MAKKIFKDLCKSEIKKAVNLANILTGRDDCYVGEWSSQAVDDCWVRVDCGIFAHDDDSYKMPVTVTINVFLNNRRYSYASSAAPDGMYISLDNAADYNACWLIEGVLGEADSDMCNCVLDIQTLEDVEKAKKNLKTIDKASRAGVSHYLATDAQREDVVSRIDMMYGNYSKQVYDKELELYADMAIGEGEDVKEDVKGDTTAEDEKAFMRVAKARAIELHRANLAAATQYRGDIMYIVESDIDWAVSQTSKEIGYGILTENEHCEIMDDVMNFRMDRVHAIADSNLDIMRETMSAVENALDSKDPMTDIAVLFRRANKTYKDGVITIETWRLLKEFFNHCWSKCINAVSKDEAESILLNHGLLWTVQSIWSSNTESTIRCICDAGNRIVIVDNKTRNVTYIGKP